MIKAVMFDMGGTLEDVFVDETSELAAIDRLDEMLRAGGDLVLLQDGRPSTSGVVANASHITAMRNATKNILYTVANSNAMNGMGEGIVYGYAMPYWKIALILLDIVILLSCAVWGFFSIRDAIHKEKSCLAAGSY